MKGDLYFYFNEEVKCQDNSDFNFYTFEKGENHQIIFYDQNKKEIYFNRPPGIPFSIEYFHNITHDSLMKEIEENNLQHLIVESIKVFNFPEQEIITQEIKDEGAELMDAINKTVKRYK